MLEELTPAQFAQWKAFESLEPFPSARADWNAAHIVQATLRNGRSLQDHVIAFGDDPKGQVKQSLEYQERVIDAWISTNNEIFRQKQWPSS